MVAENLQTADLHSNRRQNKSSQTAKMTIGVTADKKRRERKERKPYYLEKNCKISKEKKKFDL